MNYDISTYGVRVSEKGQYTFGPVHVSASRRLAAMDRASICAEMDGNTRVYTQAISYRFGRIYKRQSI